ncbi:hypothetical protein BASA81_002500 [Batrachochytrium salamandrivorans]|nr:hypothetical protein BASA81_002500 [Batrachochytrium salamandrivorans]
MSQQQQQQSSSSQDRRLNTDIHQTIRGIQTSLFKDDGNTDRDIVEHFKTLSKGLDNLVEKTRKRPVDRLDDEVANAKRQRLINSRNRIRSIFKVKN